MIELKKDELLAAPVDVWHCASYTVNHHKWSLLWCRLGDDSRFCLSFVSTAGRMYSFYTASGSGSAGVVVASAEVAVASGERNVVSYYSDLGDSPERMDAVLRLTPKHVIDRLLVLLDEIR